MPSGLDRMMGQLQGFLQVWWAKLRDEIHKWHIADPLPPPHWGRAFCDAHGAPDPLGSCKGHRVPGFMDGGSPGLAEGPYPSDMLITSSKLHEHPCVKPMLYSWDA
jgi:hypothetical protein